MAEGLSMMPWFPGDFMRSTRGWSVTAKGVYRELLDAQWDMQVLPVDPEELREIIHATPEEWAAGWRKCESKFPIVNDHRLNDRLEEHRSKAERLVNARSSAGRAGGKASVQAKVKQTLSTASTDAETSVNHPSPSPSPSPSPDASQASPASHAERAHANGVNGAAMQQAAATDSPLQGADSYPERAGFMARIKGVYPKGGRQDWITAEKLADNRVTQDGFTWQQLFEGAERYAAFCKATNRLTMNPAKFFGDVDRPFAQDWSLPMVAGAKKTKYELAMEKIDAS